jgi:hypothetical protein
MSAASNSMNPVMLVIPGAACAPSWWAGVKYYIYQ